MVAATTTSGNPKPLKASPAAMVSGEPGASITVAMMYTAAKIT
jgi:hypothetical protein